MHPGAVQSGEGEVWGWCAIVAQACCQTPLLQALLLLLLQLHPQRSRAGAPLGRG